MINFYRYLYAKRAHCLVPIMALANGTKKISPIVSTEKVIKALEEIKKIIAEDAILHYPNFGKEFETHTDSGNYQMGAVISRGGWPVAYW